MLHCIYLTMILKDTSATQSKQYNITCLFRTEKRTKSEATSLTMFFYIFASFNTDYICSYLKCYCIFKAFLGIPIILIINKLITQNSYYLYLYFEMKMQKLREAKTIRNQMVQLQDKFKCSLLLAAWHVTSCVIL